MYYNGHCDDKYNDLYKISYGGRGGKLMSQKSPFSNIFAIKVNVLHYIWTYFTLLDSNQKSV